MTDLTVPELAESISEAAVAEWKVKPGDQVRTGDVLVLIDTDKVALEVPTPVDATVGEILKQAGDDVTSGEVLARLDAPQVGAAAPAAPAAAPAPAPTPAAADAGAVQVNVPELAESISEAALAQWHCQPGDHVTAGRNLASVETDKVTLDVPAPVAGVVGEFLVAVGEDVTSGQPLTTLAPAGAASTSASTPPPASSAAPAGGNVMVSPAVRKLAADNAVDLAAVTGTGKGGRITKKDVQAHLDGKSQPAAPAAPAVAPTPAPAAPAATPVPAARPAAPPARAGQRQVRREKMSRLRKRVAERLLESTQSTAMLTTFNEVDMGAVLSARQRYRDEFEKRHGARLGFMSFFVKAVTAALRQHPVVNAAIDGDEIVYHDYCDIGIAVGSPRGLVVPVLRDAQDMTMAQVEGAIADFGARAKDGKLGIEELAGGTFTITNGGVFGSMLSTPIINPPQSAILGIHATKDRAVVVDGEVVVRPMNYVALSYDHRLIDGRDAVLFLVAVKKALEDPARLVLGL